ncbi:MAG: peptidylprolyl isomerase [Kiritimatiellia bacterium]|jgi:peptidyl-prolyl cis-trans isomerase SurA
MIVHTPPIRNLFRGVPRRLFFALAGLLAGMAPLAAQAEDAPMPPAGTVSLVDGVAAEVDGKAITLAEAMRETQQLARMLNIPPGNAAALRVLYEKALAHLIDRQLILQAYEAGEARLPEWLVENRASEIIEDRFQGDMSLLASDLAKEHLTIEQWRSRLEEEIILGAMRQTHVERQVAIRPSDVRAAFETNTAMSLELPGSVRVSMIQLLPADDEDDEAFAKRAAALHASLSEGGDFAQAARLHSRDSHAMKGGDWGFVDPEEEFRTEIVQALATLPEGGLSAPVETPAGIFLVKKTADRPDRKARFEDFREEIEESLREQESDRLYAAWMQRLREDARIRIYELPAAPGDEGGSER